MAAEHELSTSVCPEDQLLDVWCSCGARAVTASMMAAQRWHEEHVRAVAAPDAADQGKEDS